MQLSRFFGLFIGLLLPILSVPSRAATGLASSASAFVRSEANSRIDWLPWEGDWARRAKAENKPVYFFVGSFLSELSQATCRQSFTNAETVDYLNRHFVCVLVDREERPDFAAAAQYYLRIVKQTGGWPANIWLTPDLQPYEGGGYLPPSEEWGKAGFSKVARQAGETWATNPGACRARAKEAMAALASLPPERPPASSPAELQKKLGEAAAVWRATFDAANGGFGSAPKMPEPELLRFLLHGSPTDRDLALNTLRAIHAGAIHDPLDGGFFRYASDAAWHLPYLQKTLVDQARLALAFLEAHEITHEENFARAAQGAIEFALTHFSPAAGGLAASEDGTRDEHAGYFVWKATEIDAVLGKASERFKLAYAVRPEGNVPVDDDPAGRFRGENFLFRFSGRPEGADDPALRAALPQLRAVRDRRPPLPLDDRATAGAHGWLLAALARAGAQLHEPRYLEAANRVYAWTQNNFLLSENGDLRRLRGSPAPAAAIDYAAVAFGYREFARMTRNPSADQLATRLLARAGDLFFDRAQGIYLAGAAPLPAGVFIRAPAPADSLEAESLALLAGLPPGEMAAVRNALAATLNSDAPVAGEVLLTLKLGPPSR